MTTIRRADSAAGLLKLVPSLLGVHPTDSVVLLPLVNKRTIGAMRADLPTTSEQCQAAARQLVPLIAKVPLEGVIVITYGALPATVLLDWLTTALEEAGIPLVEALYVCSDHWGNYRDRSIAGDLSEIQAEHIHGAPIAASLSAGTELPAVPIEHRNRSPREPQSPDEFHQMISDVETMLLDDGSITPRQLEAMMWMLDRPSMRDYFLVTATTDERLGREALEAQLLWENGEPYPEYLAQIMLGQSPVPVDGARLRRALEVCRQVAAAAPNAGALAAAGWFSWALGKSSHAEIYATKAQKIAPEHGLAEILTSFTTAGHLPEWAFQR